MRDVKKTYLVGFVLFFCMIIIFCSEEQKAWNSAESIIRTIKSPHFPDFELSVTAFGALGDSTLNCTEAFTNAIDACQKQGGGTVVVPPGKYLLGSIHLKSNVHLYISQNATIQFVKEWVVQQPLVYTRFEGVECMNYTPLIYANGQINCAITGRGVLDGGAREGIWWDWKGPWGGNKDVATGWAQGLPYQQYGTSALENFVKENVPVTERIMGDGFYLRPNFIQFYSCQNVLVRGVTIKNSPMWCLHPVLCTNVIIDSVTVQSFGPNNDGCNPESSKNVLIKNCSFDTGDDCIAIKSGRNDDGRRVGVASENIFIHDCVMKDGHGGVVIGSECSGNVRNVFAQRCVMNSPNLERVLRIKTNSVRGGIVEDIYMRDVKVGQVDEAILRVNFNYSEGDVGNYTPVVKNIHMENIYSEKSEYAFYLTGYERSPIENIFVKNCTFSGVEKGNIFENAKGLKFKNLTINGEIYSDKKVE